MAIPRCPDDILALFDREETKHEGRKLAIEWMRQMVSTMNVGDRIMIPDPETGDLMDYTKGGKPN
jgi:hypothetical protein